MVDITKSAVSRKHNSIDKMKGSQKNKVDPPTTVTPPSTPGGGGGGDEPSRTPPPKDVTVRKRQHLADTPDHTENETEVGEDNCIPGSGDSLVSELTFQPPPEQQHQQQDGDEHPHQQVDPPGSTLRLTNTNNNNNSKGDIDGIVRTFSSGTDDACETRKYDPPAVINNRLSTSFSSYSIGEAIVTRVLGIVDLSCVSPFADNTVAKVGRGLLTPDAPVVVADDKPQWGIPPSATEFDDIDEYPVPATASSPSSHPAKTTPKEQDRVAVCVTPDSDVQKAHLQLNLPSMSSPPLPKLTSPPRKNRDSKPSSWIQKTFRSPKTNKDRHKNSGKDEAKPNQKVEMILGVTPRFLDTEINDTSTKAIAGDAKSPPRPIRLNKIIPKPKEDHNIDEEKKDDSDHKPKVLDISPVVEPVEYQHLVHSPLRGEPRNVKSPKSGTKNKNGSKSPKKNRNNLTSPKSPKETKEDTTNMVKKLTKGGPSKRFRQALQHMNKKDSDSRTASTTSSDQNGIPTSAALDTNNPPQQAKDANNTFSGRSSPSSGRISPYGNLLKALSASKTVEAFDATSNNHKEETETKVVAEYDTNNLEGAKLRLRKVLKSIKNPLKGAPLETVVEAKSEEEMSCSTHSGSELRVRVPGIHRGAKDSYISDKDLIGDEFVEEEIMFRPELLTSPHHFNDEEEDEEIMKLTEVSRTASGDELMGSKFRSDSNASSILSLGASAVASSTHSPVDSVVQTNKKSSTVAVESNNHVSESRDRLAPWKDFLGLGQYVENKNVVESKAPSKIESLMARHQSAPIGPLKNASNTEKIPNRQRSEVGVVTAPTPKPMWKAVVDPKSGRVYYYHRKTRETTWSKPPDKDLVPVKNKNNSPTSQLSPERHPTQANGTAAGSGGVECKHAEVPLIKKQSPRDNDPVVWGKKLEIARLMAKVVHPSTSTNIERILIEYEGREDELLSQLRHLSDSKPFDEPIETADDNVNHADFTPDDERLTDNAARLFTRGRSGADSTVAFSHAVGSINSGYSGHVSSGTRISEQTQQIRNTASSKPGYFAPIQEGKLSELDVPGNQSAPSPFRRRYPVRNYAPIPKNIPVPRIRELAVEEFNTRDPVFGVKETDIHERKARVLNRQVRKPSPTESAQDVNTYNSLDRTAYNGDIDDADNDRSMDSTGPTDSVSALSEADLSFVNRQETLEVTRRRALNEALAQHEWDRAADICETMRIDHIRTLARGGAGLKPNTKSSNGVHEDNRKASPLDRFISANDWDGVATYMAQVKAKEIKAQRERMRQSQTPRKQAEVFESRRSSPVSSGRGATRSTRLSGTATSTANKFFKESSVSRNDNSNNNTAARRRFGALSQLQHDEDEDYSQSSSSSSSYTSEEYTGTSGSSYTEERVRAPLPPRGTAAKEFAC